MNMKHVFTSKLIGALVASQLLAGTLSAVETKIGVVNFKACVEKSQAGMQEQKNFENLKQQMESVLEEKEKALKEISDKFNDEDFVDSLSEQAEEELKQKFRALSQELGQHQQQFYQVLQQANFRIIQALTETVNESAKELAKRENFDLIVNDEGTFFYTEALDVSDSIVKILDEKHAKMQQSNQTSN